MAARAWAVGLLFFLFTSSTYSQIVDYEGLSDDQLDYFRSIFDTYDKDLDGLISMEENLEQDKVIAEKDGKSFDEVHSKHSFERTDNDKDGFVSFEEMTAPRPPEEQCKQLYGDHAEFDGMKSCRCVKGFTADINGTCIEGGTAVCIAQFGPHADFDGNTNCMCKKGYIPDVNGTCLKGDDAACQAQFGEHANYNKENNTCVCNIGSVPDTNGTCVPASNDLCQEWFGPNTAFDGQNSCVCKKGFVYADGECFKGTNKMCASIIAGSRFDGQNSCKCRKGYEIDEARGMCIKKTKTDAGGAPVTLPNQGTVTITVVEAKHLPKMDKHTKCDPFAIITLGNSTKKTKVQKKTYKPEWGETFVLTYNETDSAPSDIEVELWDEDAAGQKEFIGRVEIALADLVTEEMVGWQDLQKGDGSLVKGYDKNISAVHLQVQFTEGLPTIPWWEPILAEKPDWVLYTARACTAIWLLYGFIIFFVFKPKPVEEEAAGEDKKEKPE